jgi:hypothetical protein
MYYPCPENKLGPNRFWAMAFFVLAIVFAVFGWCMLVVDLPGSPRSVLCFLVALVGLCGHVYFWSRRE